MIPAATHPLPRRVRRLGVDRIRRRWLAAWLGGPVIGIANGVIRELGYKERVGDLTAHQLSTVSALVLFAGYFVILQRRWPLPSRRVAVEVGAVWLALTVLFEFTFGHWVDGRTWSALLRDYDVTHGHVWPLLLAWLAVGPEAVRRLANRARRGDADAAREAPTVGRRRPSAA